MKTQLTLLIIILTGLYSLKLNGQNVAVTDDASYNPHPTAMLDVKAIDKGLLIPRLTTAQRTAISNPATGLLVFDSDLNEFFFYGSSLWISLTAGMTGDFNDLTNKPDFTGWDTNVSDDFNGQYSSLTGTPILAAVATSGSYNDLTNQPVFPPAADGSETKVNAGTNIAVSGTGTTANPYVVGVTQGTAAGQTQYWNGSQWVTNSSNIYNNGGNVGVGTTTPASKLSVGTNSEFQVNNTGNIVKLNNVTTNFPSAQGAANSLLSNDGSGNLSWNTATSFDNVNVNGYEMFDYDWVNKVNFGGTPRQGAFGFSIGTKGYIGTGKEDTQHTLDFWEYDPSTNTWSQKADFGGGYRRYAVGFSIGGKGYAGTGGNVSELKNDFWEYDPTSNTWTQKANFGGTPRMVAAGFSIGSKGYIGTGFDGSFHNDLWEYDPATNSWTQKANYGGTPRYAATGLSIGSKGYICLGYDGANKNDIWEYSPANNTWTQKANFGGSARHGATAFSLNSKGYVGTGYNGSYMNDFWEFDPALNTWTQRADFGGNARRDAVGFSIGSYGYIGTGFGQIYYNDFWVYGLSVTPDFIIPASNIANNTELFPGTILYYAGASIPDGYLLCDGLPVSRTTYSDLFAQIGTAYGSGDGSGTFNLPDLRSKTLVGQNSSDSEFMFLGQTGGEIYHQLTISEIPAHTHDVALSGGAHTHSWDGYWSVGSGSKEVRSRSYISSDPSEVTVNSSQTHSHTVSEGLRGGSGAHNNLQPYTVVNFIIKY